MLAAPPGQHTLITKAETIALIPSGPAPPYRPSADLLLTTLALAAGRRVIAVHHFGGTVIVSSMDTSARPAMPRATMLRDDIADHVVPVEDLAGLLLALATAPLIEPSPATDPRPEPPGERALAGHHAETRGGYVGFQHGPVRCPCADPGLRACQAVGE